MSHFSSQSGKICEQINQVFRLAHTVKNSKKKKPSWCFKYCLPLSLSAWVQKWQQSKGTGRPTSQRASSVNSYLKCFPCLFSDSAELIISESVAQSAPVLRAYTGWFCPFSASHQCSTEAKMSKEKDKSKTKGMVSKLQFFRSLYAYFWKEEN